MSGSKVLNGKVKMMLVVIAAVVVLVASFVWFPASSGDDGEGDHSVEAPLSPQVVAQLTPVAGGARASYTFDEYVAEHGLEDRVVER
ncbi:MAG: hypothetical protein S0880_10340 [Actinomycetota bacterium]|nr:hypothetical protein [Actinomycetota bacterium]